MSANRELLEWLGLRPADLLVYVAAGAVFAMYVVQDPAVDVILAVVAVVSALAACRVGMKPDPAFSSFTNAAKLIAYPVCMALAALFIAGHYLWWSR